MNTKSNCQVIAIGYAKRALEPGTRERKRMLRYAARLSAYHLIVFTNRSEGFPDKLSDGNLHLHATNARTRIGMLWRAYQIGRQILKESGSGRWVVSSQDPFETSLVGGAVASGNRATHHVQIHGDVFNPRTYRGSLLQRLRVWYGKRVVRRATCIRVVSARIKRSLLRLGVSAERITVLPIHADLEQFLSVGRARNYVADDKISFLYVGRFSPEKNVPLIISSFAALAHQFPHASLTLLGSGPLEPRLKEQIATLGLQGRITIRSWTDDVAGVMAQYDILCLASDHEGWAMVLLEAAAAGMPIVTTDVGCAGECVLSGENGEVVLVGDTVHYERAMEQYLKDKSLIAVRGTRSHEMAKALALPEEAYLTQLVDSFTSCQ